MKLLSASLVLFVRIAAADPGGNLRVNVKCADYWATPDTGLAVTIDGRAYPALGTNGISGFDLEVYHHVPAPLWSWTPTDVGYLVPPGVHRVSITAPGCSALEQDVHIAPYRPVILDGRLPASAALSGPTDAPDGLGIAFGAFTRAQQAHGATNDLFSTSYTFDATTVQGASLAISSQTRALVLAWDVAFGSAPVTGTSRYQTDAAVAFSGDEYITRFGFRVGGRIPLHELAVSGGSGIGGDMIITSAQGADKTAFAQAPSGFDGDWYIPLWTQLTLKPSCNWGATLYASYDFHPTARDESAPAFGASILYEPSAACSEPAGVRVL